MEEDAFYDRLKEIYNDHFLTDRYYDGTNALDLLDQEDYQDAYWFDTEFATDDEARNEAASATNRALAREPHELVAHVVRENLPYTEILTADYTMVNWYSAQSLGVNFNGDPTYEDSRNERTLHVSLLSRLCCCSLRPEVHSALRDRLPASFSACWSSRSGWGRMSCGPLTAASGCSRTA
jgi:hypothetical protein